MLADDHKGLVEAIHDELTVDSLATQKSLAK
jgi:hypothetical protein